MRYSPLRPILQTLANSTNKRYFAMTPQTLLWEPPGSQVPNRSNPPMPGSLLSGRSTGKMRKGEPMGKPRKWETAERKTRGKSGVDAVAILALLERPSQPTSTIIIHQYRPPVDAVVIELPAGLVDEGDSLEETALRELYEETGYGKGEAGGEAKVESISPIIVCDPGMSAANMSLATVRVTLPASSPPPEAKLEPGEHIVTEIVALKDLKDKLDGYAKKEGWTVDARLMHLAEGLRIAANL